MDKKDKLHHTNPPFHAYKGDNPYIFVSYAHIDADRVFPELKRFHNQGILYGMMMELGLQMNGLKKLKRPF